MQTGCGGHFLRTVSESTSELMKLNTVTETEEIRSFAAQQIRLSTVLRKENGHSEADAIEKLVVPVWEKLYGKRLYFERASRAGAGAETRKWDLEVYDSAPDKPKNDSQLVALVECKNIHETFRAKVHRLNGVFKWKFAAAIKRFSTVRDYIDKGSPAKTKTFKDGTPKNATNAFGDMLLQVWIYGVCGRYTKANKRTTIVWSNGTTWVVFDPSFFNSGENPPDDIPFTADGAIICNSRL